MQALARAGAWASWQDFSLQVCAKTRRCTFLSDRLRSVCSVCVCVCVCVCVWGGGGVRGVGGWMCLCVKDMFEKTVCVCVRARVVCV